MIDMLVGSIAFVAIGKAALFGALGLHQKWWRYFGLRDLWVIVRAAALASAAMVVIFTVAKPFDDDLPRSVVVLDFMLTLLFVGGARMAVRFVVERPARTARRRKARDVLVIGAGSGGQMVVRELQLNPDLGENPIGFVDDDPRKQGMRLLGLKVLGTTEKLEPRLERLKPDEVIIAIPSAPGALRGKVVAACREREHPRPNAADRLRVAARRRPAHPPAPRGPGRGRARPRAGRDGARLGSAPISATASSSSPAPAARSVPSSAARSRACGRSCSCSSTTPRTTSSRSTARWSGSGTSRASSRCSPTARSRERMLEVMQRFKPDVVFHAAAYKHVPLIEANPLEAVRNNAIATRVTAETAAVAGAERFVLISTDKAVNPRTVMGASKAMAEWIVEAAGHRHPRPASSRVRFGNVLGSSGQRRADLPQPDRARRPGDRHRPRDDAATS